MAEVSERLRRLIKHRRSGKYYAGRGIWTADLEDAQVFDDLLVAMETGRAEGLEDCCVVVIIGDQEVDAQFAIR